MQNLFEATTVTSVRERLGQLRPDSPRQWGSMNAAQTVAHCSMALEMALGDTIPLRASLSLRIIGRMVKPLAVGDDKPIRRNAPTTKNLIVQDERDLTTEKQRLHGLINRFAAAGPAGCTTHPHSFFGPLTPEQWAVLMYKHLDHHLRQFGV
jgi:hypothetical protein